MKGKKLLTGILVCVGLIGSKVEAGDLDGAIFISPEISYHFFDDDRRVFKNGQQRQLDDALEYGLSVEKLFGNIGLGGKFGYGKADVKGTSSSQDFYDLAVYGKYYLDFGNLLPYVSLGLTETKLKGKYLGGIFGGLGINYLIGDNWGIKAGIDAYNLKRGRTDIMPTIGLTYAMGLNKDSDGDGVYDNVDQCPNTPKGVKVDATGCPIDSDKDGVPDYKDHCPDTPLGVKVDENGCPLDSDGDGVPDYKDKCPNTPAGTKVDENGCPVVIDTDGDGVPDNKDKCPDTPKGVKVDAVGCPLDSDGDGVPDYRDRCPNTPKGYKVDKYGCFVSARLDIHFDYNKWDVKPKYYPELEKFAQFLKDNPNIKVELQGHTDKRGSAKYNLWLSQKRAEAVKKVLVEKFGISPDRIIAKGYGESQPICHEDTEECYAKNRRVVAKIIKE